MSRFEDYYEDADSLEEKRQFQDDLAKYKSNHSGQYFQWSKPSKIEAFKTRLEILGFHHPVKTKFAFRIMVSKDTGQEMLYVTGSNRYGNITTQIPCDVIENIGVANSNGVIANRGKDLPEQILKNIIEEGERSIEKLAEQKNKVIKQENSSLKKQLEQLKQKFATMSKQKEETKVVEEPKEEPKPPVVKKTTTRRKTTTRKKTTTRRNNTPKQEK